MSSKASEYAVPAEEALERLEVIPDYDNGSGPGPCVHSFAASGIGLLGAHWRLEEVRALFEREGVEQAGPGMTGMRHGLVCVFEDDGRQRTLFFETKFTGDEAA